MWLDLCLPLTKESESCYLKAYPDPASPLAQALLGKGLWYKVLQGAPIPQELMVLSGSPWTVGYGATGPNIGPKTVWTQIQANNDLVTRLNGIGWQVDKLVKVPISDQQKAALVDFAYNVGTGALSSSTLLKKLNSEDYQGAADQFPLWNKAGGKVMNGLVTRREKERDLFLS